MKNQFESKVYEDLYLTIEVITPPQLIMAELKFIYKKLQITH